ncbi:coilin isoform 3-T4 [Polymixia lowei]
MATSSANSIRVRLYFDYPPPAVSDCRMCWVLVDLNKCRVVADLESIIRDKFDFGRKNILNLFIEDCYLPHTESIYVVRDNDSIRVKVDTVVQVNGDSNHPDILSENSKKRRRQTEDDEPVENGVNVKWKKKKKNIEESLERETKRTSCDERNKDTQKKHSKKKKKGKEAEGNVSTAFPKLPTPTKKPLTTVGQPVKSTSKPPGPTPADVNSKTKAQNVSSSDSSDSSSEEDEASKKMPGPKTVPKMPCSVPAPPKAPPKAKLPTTKSHPRPASSSSETDSSSDETPSKLSSQSQLKKTPLPKSVTSVAPKGRTSNTKSPPRLQPGPSASQLPNGTKKQMSGCVASLPAEKVPEQPESSDPDSSSEEEIKLVIKRPLQGQSLGMGLAPAVGEASLRSRGRGNSRGGGRGERGSGRGGASAVGAKSRGGRGHSREFHFDYYSDSLTNSSVVLQNQIETVPKRDYNAMPLLAAPPQVGQEIAFKLLELTENYTPEVSEYKEGKIVSFDPTTKQIELELLNTFQAPVEPGKFDLVYQNPDGSERVEYAVSRGSLVTERWDSLLEPRLVI